MKSKFAKLGVLLVLMLSSHLTLAEDFQVGRVKVVLPGEGWRYLPVADKGLEYGGDRAGSLESQTKAFVKESADKMVQAVVVVRGSLEGIGGTGATMSYSPNCKSNEDWYAQGNAGFKRPYYDCWRVAGAYLAKGMIEAISPDAANALEGDGASFPVAMQPILSHYATSNGTFLEVTLYLAPNFTGRDGDAPSGLPAKVNPRTVNYAKEVAAQVKSAATTVSGTFTLPSLAFVD